MNMEKDIIETLLWNLINSSETRQPAEGKSPFRGALLKLSEAHSSRDVQALWTQINRYIAGIEAYGQFTDEELSEIDVARRALEKSSDHQL